MYRLRPIFFAAFFFSIHLALLTYLNSTLVESFGNESFASAIFTIGATLSFILLVAAPRIIRGIGLVPTAIGGLLITGTLLTFIGTGSDWIVVWFIIYFALNSFIAYLFDLFVEHYSVVESVGKTRGAFLLIQNLGWVAGPLVTGGLVAGYGVHIAYIIAAVMVLIALIIVATSERRFTDRSYRHTGLRIAFQTLQKRASLRRAVTINLLLQLFYAWMVLYSPLYLAARGFGWKEIGIIFSIMLIPFVLLQYPMGRFADRIGEPRLIRIGLLIMSIATLLFGIVGGHSIALYAGILFITRVGASIIEVATDSYFFRQITDADTGVVSLYRTMFPLAYIISPIAGAGVLVLTSYHGVFIVLGIGLIGAMVYARRLTKLQVHNADPVSQSSPHPSSL